MNVIRYPSGISHPDCLLSRGFWSLYFWDRYGEVFILYGPLVLPTQCIGVFFMDMRKKKGIISIHNIKCLLFVTKRGCVYCAVRNEYLNIVEVKCIFNL
jgi:hypothetical protein